MTVYHPSSFFKGRKILLGITGGIAAVKVVSLARYLAEKGAQVMTCMTRHALKIVGKASFEAVTGNKAYFDLFESEGGVTHISLARGSDCILVAPATANIIGKMAYGIADDLLSTLLLVEPQKVILAPAMNVSMWKNPVVQDNIRILRGRGVRVIPPQTGILACGEEGEGRLPEVEEIVEALFHFLYPSPALRGRKVLVTVGATREWIDPVRFLSNPSSGLMGCALASVFRAFGAEVRLIAGSTSVRLPFGVDIIRVDTALEMYEVLCETFPWCDILVMSAAVSDFRPACFSPSKIKRGKEPLSLSLVPNPDILQQVGREKGHRIIVGFCAETERVLEEAKKKLKAKNMDMIVANLVGSKESGFAAPTNKAWIVDRKGNELEFPLLEKVDLAEKIVEHLVSFFPS